MGINKKYSGLWKVDGNIHNDSVWLKKLDPIITERNNSKTKYDSKTNSWLRFIMLAQIT